MNRRPFLAGNWKMHGTKDWARDLANSLGERLAGERERDVAVFPPFVLIEAVADALRDVPVMVGGQACHADAEGAFTGEVSPEMLRDAGCDLVLVGHSERRHLCGETDQAVRAKLEGALRAGLRPIVCVGETIEERDAGQTMDVVRTQVLTAFEDVPVDAMADVTLAYEPVWAIGTGRTATPDQAEEVHAFARDLIRQLYDEATSQTVRIQYGGSVKPDNIGTLMSQPNIDGALVGGASLDAGSFCAIVGYGRG